MYKLGLEKAEEPEIKLPTFYRESKGISEKNIYLSSVDYTKAFDCVEHNKLWKILEEMGILDHLTCILRNLYENQKQWLELDCNNGLIPNWERCRSRLYIVTLLI